MVEERDDQRHCYRNTKLERHFFLETMFLRTVSMISRNLLDQLTQNFKYAFSTCVTIAPARINRKILFFIFF